MEPPTEYHGKKINLEHPTGTTCRVVDFAPLKAGDDGTVPEGFMHRTQSLDFGVVLKGRIILELDDGVETEMKEGDIVVQRYGFFTYTKGNACAVLIARHRGTIHAWKNLSNANCRMLFVLVPAEKVKNESTGEYLETTPTPTLSE